MKNDLGLSKGLLSSVSSLLKDSSKQRAEESKVESEKLAAYSKAASLRPLSMEDAKVASYAAKAPERRVNDTITQLYTQSVAEHNAKQKAEAEAIKTAYGKMGAVAPIAESKQGVYEGVHVLDNEGETHVHVKDAKNVKELDDAIVHHLVTKHKMPLEHARKTYREVADDTPFHHNKPEKDHAVDVVRSKAEHAKQIGDYVHSMVAEAKELSPKQKKIAKVAGDKSAIDAMDFKVLRARKAAQAGAVSDEKILDGEQIEELKDTPGNSTHQCAIHVKHATMGEGRTLTSQHAQPDTEGQISWYAVMFEHGIEKVETKDLEILESEWHNQHPYSKSSKKMGIKPKK